MKEVVCPNCGQIARNNRDTCALCGASLKPVRRRGRGLVALLLILLLLALCAGAYVWLNGSPLPMLESLLGTRQEGSEEMQEVLVEPVTAEPVPEQPVEVPAEQPAEVPAEQPAEAPAEPAAAGETAATPAQAATAQPIPASAWAEVERIYARDNYSLGLRADGTVLLAGEADFDLSGWTDVAQLCPGRRFAAALRSDGTVLVAGELAGKEAAADWTGVARLYTDGEEILAALCADGTVRACNPSFYDVEDWEHVKDLALGWSLILGLTEDGRVLAAGDTSYAQGVENWNNVRQIAAGMESSFGLTVDGTVLCDDLYLENTQNQLGRDPVYSWGGVEELLYVDYHPIGVDSLGYIRLYQQAYAGQEASPVYTAQKALVIPGTGTTLILDREGRVGYYDGSGAFDLAQLKDWTGVKDIVCGLHSAAALREDGTVLVLQHPEDAVFDVSGWTEIVAIAMGRGHLLGLRADGTVLAAGDNSLQQCALR